MSFIPSAIPASSLTALVVRSKPDKDSAAHLIPCSIVIYAASMPATYRLYFSFALLRAALFFVPIIALLTIRVASDSLSDCVIVCIRRAPFLHPDVRHLSS